jgi:hypothetical protein
MTSLSLLFLYRWRGGTAHLCRGVRYVHTHTHTHTHTHINIHIINIHTHTHTHIHKQNERGSFVAVGTFKAGIEIWDVDVIDPLEPTQILGGEKILRGGGGGEEE